MNARRKPDSERLVRRDAWALPKTWEEIDREAKKRGLTKQYVMRERLERREKE